MMYVLRVQVFLAMLTLILAQEYDHQDTWGGDCLTGNKQSPINIESAHASSNPADLSISLTLQDRSYIQIPHDHSSENLFTPFALSELAVTNEQGTKVFNSLQFHLHHRSEHYVDGIEYDAELHVVHVSSDNTLAVVGVLFKGVDEMFEDPFDSWDLDTKQFLIEKFPINLEAIPQFYHYEGSLTTPSCTEGVLWFVAASPIRIKAANIKKLTKLIQQGHDNSRNIQELNGRKVVKVLGSAYNQRQLDKNNFILSCILVAVLLAFIITYLLVNEYAQDGESRNTSSSKLHMLSTRSDIEMRLINSQVVNPELETSSKRIII